MHPVTVTAKKSPIIRVNTFNIVEVLLLFIIFPLYKNSVSFCLNLVKYRRQESFEHTKRY